MQIFYHTRLPKKKEAGPIGLIKSKEKFKILLIHINGVTNFVCKSVKAKHNKVKEKLCISEKKILFSKVHWNIGGYVLVVLDICQCVGGPIPIDDLFPININYQLWLSETNGKQKLYKTEKVFSGEKLALATLKLSWESLAEHCSVSLFSPVSYYNLVKLFCSK